MPGRVMRSGAYTLVIWSGIGPLERARYARTPWVSQRLRVGARVTLSAAQVLVNQRIGQAAIRRMSVVGARLSGRAPAAPRAGRSGRVSLTRAQLRINQRVFQAAIRRAAALAAALEPRPAPRRASARPDRIVVSVRQLVINQRIAQAAVRRANALLALTAD